MKYEIGSQVILKSNLINPNLPIERGTVIKRRGDTVVINWGVYAISYNIHHAQTIFDESVDPSNIFKKLINEK